MWERLITGDDDNSSSHVKNAVKIVLRLLVENKISNSCRDDFKNTPRLEMRPDETDGADKTETNKLNCSSSIYWSL